MSDTATDAIRGWLIEQVASYVDRPPAEIDPDAPFVELGLDSVYSLTLCGDAEDRYGCRLDPMVTRDHPTISALAGHLGAILNNGQ
jgi:acyl carrier protein